MLIDKNASANQLNPTKLEADGMVYINTNQWFLAYSAFAYLHQNTKEKSVALLYNMALCHRSANEYTKAIAMLGEAQMKIATPSSAQHVNNHLPDNLLTDEYENGFYRLALNETMVLLNTNLVKLRIRRVLVDINLKLENWQEVIRLAALPEMDRCKNVIEALTTAKSKTNT
ncbi:hypothetical protein [Pedobacter agri]|uniref:hypothetical protein n=1 Tax=Pedobacter agri TaxID=454586 RepID=UPI00292D7CC4|nr:hypothetical protein [Pedobacter agri]